MYQTQFTRTKLNLQAPNSIDRHQTQFTDIKLDLQTPNSIYRHQTLDGEKQCYLCWFLVVSQVYIRKILDIIQILALLGLQLNLRQTYRSSLHTCNIPEMPDTGFIVLDAPVGSNEFCVAAVEEQVHKVTQALTS